MSSPKKFSKDYSKAIAEALREKEDAAEPVDKTQLMRDAYTALCYDDPRVDSDEACRLLAKELVKEKSAYALSERLVEGIRQATARFQVQPPKKEEQEEEETPKEEEEEEPQWQVEGSASATGYAALAVAVFCEIPLRCCQASDLKIAQTMLGSYRGVQDAPDELEQVMEEKMNALNLAKEEEADQKQQSEKEVATPPPQQGEYEEVWADESDPSDFVFESNAQDLDWSAWGDTSFDPEKLSQPIVADGWPQVQRAVSNLLQDLTVNKFLPLPSSMWKKHSDTLSQLALTLLVDSSSPMSDGLRQWGTQPINVLRDRILHKNKDSLTDYLRLVQSLIAVDNAQDDRKAPMAPASIVGLASLSSICTQAKQLKEIPKIRKNVLECCEDICSLVERAVPAESETWVRLVWALLPLLELISNTQADGTSLDASHFVSPGDAQWLLNSGLFRELILLYTKTASSASSSPAVDTTRQQLLQCLQMLSLRNMNILGKYSWRVPDLSKLIHEDPFQSENTVDALMWALMGLQLAGTSALRMRNVKVVTVDSSKETALSQWSILCGKVVASIKVIGTLRTRAKEDPSKDDSWKEPITELSRFSNCLVTCDALPPLWQQIMTKNDLAQHVKPIKDEVSNLPPPMEKHTKDADKSAENDKAGDPLERPENSFEQEVGMVHKAIKVLTVSLQGERGMSSKTD